MIRVPERELMDAADQARAYAEADFAEPHEAFVRHFGERFPAFQGGDVVDLGCGPADVTTRFARTYPGARVLGIDGSPAMLAEGRRRIASHPAGERITLRELFLPSEQLPRAGFDAVISNSLLHHVSEPAVIWSAARAAARTGAPIFVMDLMRPPDLATAERFVALYAGDAPPVLQHDYFASLLAAYEPDEVRAQLVACGLDHLVVEPVSDRHLVAWGVARAP
ncbi:MAG: methyltransferase domain-containing protein [bacterium]